MKNIKMFEDFSVNENKRSDVEEFLENFVSNSIEGNYGFPEEIFWDAGSGEAEEGKYSLDGQGNERAWVEIFINRDAFAELNFDELSKVFEASAEGKYWETSVLSNEDTDPCSVTFNVEFGNDRFRR